MNINIEYFGQLSEITKKKNEYIQCDPNSTLKDLMQSLASDYGTDFQKTVFNGEGEIHPTLLVVLNEVAAEKDRDVLIEDGATLKLFTAIAGG